MYIRITDFPLTEAINDDLCVREAGPQIVDPGQSFGKIVGPKRPQEPFFIYGYVDYLDAFNHKWRYRFAYSHDPERFSSEAKDDRWIAYHEHNDEISQPKRG